jgi:protease I
MAIVLMPLPDSDFDPTESGVPWRTMRDRGHRVVFATPSGRTARADPKMVTGEGLGVFSPFLKADANGRSAYREME